jgi:hypothetical protein
MAEEAQVKETVAVRPLAVVLKEVEEAIQRERAAGAISDASIKDLRWKFDQVSAKMNQAIYNEQQDLIHNSTLQTVAVLIEILARS